MMVLADFRIFPAAAAALCLAGLQVRAGEAEMAGIVSDAWAVAEQRAEATVDWLESTHGSPQMFTRYPILGDPVTGRWTLATTTKDWRDGFWPGILWMLAQRTGSEVWRQRAESWSAPLEFSTNIDHDIGFITVTSFAKGGLFHDDLTDPGGNYRHLAKSVLSAAGAKLDARFNKPNGMGAAVPAGFTRSWNTPFEDPYPVCIDNLMNLEVMFLAYEMNGRKPSDRHLFEHALQHARSSIGKHMRPDGSTYHVVRHFEHGPLIGMVERKNTHQGYAHESTWSRGQAWAIHGFTTTYRFASRDPATDAADILSAAQACADYFLDHLPHGFQADIHNHRAGDFVPPSDFDVALGEPPGPWNDANNNYNPATGTGLGDRLPAIAGYTLRDSSAAAVAASGLIELSGHVSSPGDRARYMQAAENLLHCLVRYDGPDPGTVPDYFSTPGDAMNPGILKGGCNRWGESNKALIFGDYYFLEALSRYEALKARRLLETSRKINHSSAQMEFSFEISDPPPTLRLMVQRSPDLSTGSWFTVAAKTGAGSWTGVDPVFEDVLPDGKLSVRSTDPAPGGSGFYRVLSRSIGGGP